MQKLVAVFFVLVAGCGSTPPAASPPPASTPETSAAVQSECNAEMTKTRPPGWIDAGKLEVTVLNGKPTSVEARDSSGKTLSKEAIAPGTPGSERDVTTHAACRTGGYLILAPSAPPADGVLELIVVKPAKADEPGDVAMLCSQPSVVTQDLDAAQRATIAADYYEKSLTSPRWRNWLAALGKQLAHADSSAAGAAARQKASADLTAAGGASCWFATALAH